MKAISTMFAMPLILFAGHPALAQASGWGRGDPVPATMPVNGAKSGNPLYDMPEGQTLISAFGERPVFSPDGTRIAFIGKSYGDAFEYDLKTGTIRNLTSHAPNNGFLRVHYMADGSYLLLGPRFPAAAREETRFSRIELFWMDAAASRSPVALGRTVFEGVAVSPTSNLISWSEIFIDPAGKAPASTTLFTARLAVSQGRGKLESVHQVVKTSECVFEAQDFFPDEKAVTMPCYTFQGEERARVMSVELATGRMTTYPTPPNQYSEIEGMFPDGKRAFVECADDRRKGMDLCVLDLDPVAPRYTRMTNIVRFGPFKYGNPVFRADGRMAAAQIGHADVADAGVGEGIVLIQLKDGF